MLFLGLSVPGEVPRCSASVLVLLAGFLNSVINLAQLVSPSVALPAELVCLFCVSKKNLDHSYYEERSRQRKLKMEKIMVKIAVH